MDPLNLPRHSGRESTIRRDAEGRWFHDGQRVEHPRLIECFERWIDRAEDGRYCLRNAVDWVYIALEGPPCFVRSLRFAPAGEVRLVLSDGSVETLDDATLRQGTDGALYCNVRGGRLAARFDRSAMAQLMDLVDEDDSGVFLKLGDRKVRPPVYTDPLENASGGHLSFGGGS